MSEKFQNANKCVSNQNKQLCCLKYAEVARYSKVATLSYYVTIKYILYIKETLLMYD